MTVWKPTKDNRIKKRGEVYWARFMLRNQTVQESLGTKSFETAKRMVENIEKDILLGVNWRKDREIFESAWPQFLADKAEGKFTEKARPKTLKEYVGFGERYYMPKFKNYHLGQINEDAWAELVDEVRVSKPGMHFDNLRKYLMGFLAWAHLTGKISQKPRLFDPDIDRKEAREEDGPGVAYTLEQLGIMRELAEKCGPRFNLFMLMAQYMGFRPPGEITQLKKDRVDLEHGLIKLRKADTKTKRGRTIPIHSLVLGPLTEQMDASGSSPYLFPNAHDKTRPMDSQGFKKYWLEILAHPKIAGRVYDFRHTFITHAIMQGMNPSVVAKMTGTSLQMIDRRYLHLTKLDLNSELGKFKL